MSGYSRWIGEWILDVLSEWIGGWISRMDKRYTDGCKVSDERWVDNHNNKMNNNKADNKMNGWVNGWVYECVGGCMDRCMELY